MVYKNMNNKNNNKDMVEDFNKMVILMISLNSFFNKEVMEVIKNIFNLEVINSIFNNKLKNFSNHQMLWIQIQDLYLNFIEEEKFGFYYFICQIKQEKQLAFNIKNQHQNIMEFLNVQQLIVTKMKNYVMMNFKLENIQVFQLPNLI